jgi:hypothetical protein
MAEKNINGAFQRKAQKDLNSKKQKDFLKKIKDNIFLFSKRRNEFLLLIFAVVIWNQSSTIESLNETTKNKDEFINKISSYTTYITDNGVVKQYEKEVFDVYKEKTNVAKVLSDYLIQSTYNLTDGYKKSIFADSEELYAMNKNLQVFYDNYIVSLHHTEDDEVYKKQLLMASNDWKQILRWFTASINKNDLPHTIDVKKSDINIVSWNTNKNVFSILIEVPVYANSRNNNNIEDKGITIATIKAEGYYDLMNKTGVNSNGMFFTKLSLNHPQINHGLTKESKNK